MGKIRIKTLGDEEAEKEQKKKLKQKKEEKKLEKVKAEVATETEETHSASSGQAKTTQKTNETKGTEEKKETKIEKKTVEVKKTGEKSKKEKFSKKRERSKKYKTVVKLVEKNKIYSLSEALEILPKIKISNFDETVELHINTTEPGISGKVTLPHGTGKQLRVAVADDATLKKVESGKIDFDVLLATPQMMPKLARFARVLGPKGLMPNPKNGTVTQNPEEEAKKYQGGHMSFKTEAKMPIVHLIVGKLSFGDKKLLENIKTAIKGINVLKIKNVTLKSTMSPALKIDFTKI